jgi:methanogenic corrinoid protein MtbC1
MAIRRKADGPCSQSHASEILLEALVPGIQEVGRFFEAGEAFLPEMMISYLKSGVVAID